MSKGDKIETDMRMAMTQIAEKITPEVSELVKEAIALGVMIGATTGAEVGASAAIKAMESEKKKAKKQEQDWKHHNTKLLLRNYRRLSSYYKEAVFTSAKAEESDESFEQIMRRMGRPKDEAVFVESIQKNYIATRTIMTHVNKMLECYKNMCLQSKRPGDDRRWRIVDALYLSGPHTTATQVAQNENVDRSTIYRDIDICVNDLTPMFFGASGLDDL